MSNYFQIKDLCRQGLIKYLGQACAKIRLNDDAKILDIGCGTGVPTLWLAEHVPGTITAIDMDEQAISFLQKKFIEKNLQNKVKAWNSSFFDFDFDPEGYDLILAEGFLNVIGFEKGFNIILQHLKNNSYLVIHDEFKDHEKKCGFMKAKHCEIIETIVLDEKIWWNDYYLLLEEEIGKLTDSDDKELFKSDLEEIKTCKVDPLLFRSIYYVIKKL